MATEEVTHSAGYWYDDRSSVDAVDVLNALRRYRTAENAAQRRAREALGVGENALLALRVLLDADQTGRRVNSKQLAEELGHVERHPDPHDRRGVFLTASGESMRQAFRVLDQLDESGAEVASSLNAAELRVIVSFLEDMTRVVDHIAPEDAQSDDVAVA